MLRGMIFGSLPGLWKMRSMAVTASVSYVIRRLRGVWLRLCIISTVVVICWAIMSSCPITFIFWSAVSTGVRCLNRSNRGKNGRHCRSIEAYSARGVSGRMRVLIILCATKLRLGGFVLTSLEIPSLLDFDLLILFYGNVRNDRCCSSGLRFMRSDGSGGAPHRDWGDHFAGAWFARFLLLPPLMPNTP